MALLEAKTKSALATDVFEVGKYGVSEFTIKTSSDSSSPPKPLFIVSPTSRGKYPVVLFLHGFCLANKFYNSLLKHVSSHGYILVAPQLYPPKNLLIVPDGRKEIDYAAAVTNWLAEGLFQLLPTNVQPDLDKLVLAGHSRGGKAAFALALGLAKTSLKFSLLIGVDPVAGKHWEISRVKTIILSNVPESFDINLPVAVIGTGLGPTPNHLLLTSAPDGVNHKEFFNKSKRPRCHFVTSDYGHMDMLDDDLGFWGWAINFLCTNGKGPRDPMRKCVGGIMVAFIRAYFEGDSKDLRAIVTDPDIAPVKLDSVKFDEE